MKATERLSFDNLEYSKGILSGLLNFSLRSGLFCCDGMPQLDPDFEEKDKNPHFRCRCGYEAALQTALMCIEHVTNEKKLDAQNGLLYNVEARNASQHADPQASHSGQGR